MITYSAINRFINSRLIKDSGTYFLFKALDRLIPFLVLPIITRILSPAEYGIYVLFIAFAGVILPLTTLCVDSSILLNYFKVRQEDFRSYFSSGYVLIIASALLALILLLLLRHPISSMASFPDEWIIAVLVLCFFQYNSNLALNIFQVKREPRKYGLYSLSLTGTRNLLMLFFVVIIGMKWQGIVIGHLIAYFMFFLLSIYLFVSNKLFTKEIKREYIVDNIKVGYPLTLHATGAWLGSAATRIIIGGLLGTAAAGTFGAGATLGLVVGFVQDSFNKAYVPYLFSVLNEYSEKIEYELIKLTYAYNLGLLLFAVAFGILSSLFVEAIFGQAYGEAKQVVLLISLACAFDGMYKMYVNYIFYTKKTQYIFLITLTAGILNVVLSYFTVKMWGLIGGALSLFLTNVTSFFLAWYVANKVFPMAWLAFFTSGRKLLGNW